MEEQIYGVTSALLVSKARSGLRIDAEIINSWTQKHAANMIIKITFKRTKIVVSVEGAK